MSKPKVDIFFLADATGSMTNCINNVKANIVSTYEMERECANCDFEMGIGFYRDINVEGESEEYGVLQTITKNATDLQAAAASLIAKGGGDAAESQMYALTQIAQNRADIGWRTGATRIIAWFGDIYGHANQSQDRVMYTVELANKELQDANISVLAFSMAPTNKLNSTGGGGYVAASQITSVNNGSVTENVDQDDAVSVIFEFIQNNVPGFNHDMLIRKNQNALTPAEWTDFISAINSLMAAPESTIDPNYAQFVQCHADAMKPVNRSWGAHGGNNFLTWHRDYMYHFEQRLRSFKPNVTLPYWDWVNDREIPAQLSVPADLTRWNVTRNANPNFSNLGPPSELAAAIAEPDFATFTGVIEAHPFHNTVHNDIGGTMATAGSPADPIFWLHHCFIDKIFADWHVLHPRAVHPNMAELLLPAPYLTKTNAQVWNISELDYDYI
jgi:hypothetical protein